MYNTIISLGGLNARDILFHTMIRMENENDVCRKEIIKEHWKLMLWEPVQEYVRYVIKKFLNDVEILGLYTSVMSYMRYIKMDCVDVKKVLEILSKHPELSSKADVRNYLSKIEQLLSDEARQATSHHDFKP